MTSADIQRRIQESEERLATAEVEFGKDAPRVAECLEELAALLKSNKVRLLDAANMEARANVIRTSKQATHSVEQTTSLVPEVSSASDTAPPQPVVMEHLKACRFCAEQIKADAILCRFCGKNLRRSLTVPLIGIAVLIVVVVSWVALSQIGKNAVSTPAADPPRDTVSTLASPLPSKGSVAGAVFLNRRDGEALILRGQQIVLCRGTSQNDFENGQIMQAFTRSTSTMSTSKFEGLMIAFKDFVRARTIAANSTGVDGKFLLPDVPVGDYCLVSHFDHLLGERSEYACWVVPVTVKSGETSQCDLNNLNVTVTCRHY